MDKLNTDTELAAVMADCAAVSLIVYTCGFLRGRFKVPLYTIFATQAQDMTSQVLYLRHSAHDAIVYVRSQALYLRYSACDAIVIREVTGTVSEINKLMTSTTF